MLVDDVTMSPFHLARIDERNAEFVAVEIRPRCT